MTQSNAISKPDAMDLTISKTFSAPREKVFRAWTKSRHIINWWGPEGFTMPSHKMDIHPGGIYRCDLRGPDGEDHWVQGVFTEMVEPSHIAFTHSWNENGNFTPETHATVELTEEGGKTSMVFYQTGFQSAEDRDGHNGGWAGSFDRLEKYLNAEKNEF